MALFFKRNRWLSTHGLICFLHRIRWIVNKADTLQTSCLLNEKPNVEELFQTKLDGQADRAIHAKPASSMRGESIFQRPSRNPAKPNALSAGPTPRKALNECGPRDARSAESRSRRCLSRSIECWRGPLKVRHGLDARSLREAACHLYLQLLPMNTWRCICGQTKKKPSSRRRLGALRLAVERFPCPHASLATLKACD